MTTKARNNKSGFSLVELTIGLVLVGGIMLMFSGVMNVMSKSSSQSSQMSDAQQNSRIALDLITETLRKAGSDVDTAGGQLSLVHAGTYQVAINTDLDQDEVINGKPALNALSVDHASGSIPGVYTPGATYTTGAETVVFTLDSDRDGSVSTHDRGDDEEEDVENTSLYALKRHIYGFDGSKNDVRSANIALVRGPIAYPDRSRPPVLFEYYYDHDNDPSTRDKLWGDKSPEDGKLTNNEIAGLQPVPDDMLFAIHKVKVNVVSESIRYNDTYENEGGFAGVTMSSQVYVRNAQRNETSRVFGRVYVDANGNGQVDANEPGIPDVIVRAGHRKSRTDDFGMYSIPVAPGAYTVSEKDPTGFTSTTSNDVSVSVVPGEKVRVDFGDRNGTKYGTIAGSVFEDLNRDGKIGANEPGIGAVEISIETGLRAKTEEDGSYRMMVPTGSHVVTEVDLEGYASTTPNVVSVSVLLNTTVTVDFGDYDGNVFGTIEGYVYLDDDEDGVRDFGESGIEDAVIHLSNADSVYTNVDGYYSFEIEPGTYTVWEVDPQGYSSTSPNLVEDVVVAPDTSITVNFGDMPAQDVGFEEVALADLDEPVIVRAVDLKEDGRRDVDIVLASHTPESGGDGNILVYHNEWESSDTSIYELFHQSPSDAIDAGSEVSTLLVHDVSGDGRPDLISGHDDTAGENIHIWSNERGGKFSSSPDVSIASGIASIVTQIRVGDVDGDSNDDLVVGQRSSYGLATGAVEIFTSFGSGNVTPHMQLDSGQAGMVMGTVAAVELADLDEDDDLDLVVASNSSEYWGYIDIFENTGSGNLAWTSRYVAKARVNDIEVVDLSGSNRPDILAAVSVSMNAGGLQIWANNEDGFGKLDQSSFEYESGQAAKRPTEYVSAGGEALTMAVQSIDGDIVPEVLLGTRTSSTSGALLLLSKSGSHAVQVTNLKAALPGEVVSIDIADFNKDDREDILVATRTGASQGKLAVYFGKDMLAP